MNWSDNQEQPHESVRFSYMRGELINFLTTLAAMAASADNEDYRRGFLAALAAVAGLIGVPWQSIVRR